jgi:CRISPR-associated protein Cmr2
MIHDYYLNLRFKPEKNDQIKTFEEWEKINQKRLKNETEESKRIIWQQEEIVGKKKIRIRKSLQNDNKKTTDFFPTADDLKNLPQNSALIKISFTLKKPYTSKDEGEFHIIAGKIFENPIVRDKLTGLPMVRPSTWKGHLRYAAGMVEWGEVEKKKLIKRLFGSETAEGEDDETSKGRLYFFPTFFEGETERDVITPLKRDTRTPTKKGPIPLEVIKPGKNGDFYLLYLPYPKGKDFKEDEIKEDLEFLSETLKLMFYTYGFSAKKTSGFGIIKDLQDKNVEIYPEDKKSIFSILYTKVNKTVNHGAYK